MTLVEIVAELDRTIARWSEARAILASLLPEPESSTRLGQAERETASARAALPEPIYANASSSTVPVQVLKPRAQRQRRTARPKETVATALTSTGPQGMIVVSAAEAARIRQLAAETQPESHQPPSAPAGSSAEPGHSLDDLVRELTHRSNGQAAGSPE